MSALSAMRLRVSVLAAASAALAGCNSGSSGITRDSSPVAVRPKKEANPHDHAAGVHGGAVRFAGSDEFHAEAIFESGGTVALYTFGRDETVVRAIDEQNLDGHIRLLSDSTWMPVVFKPQPQAGDGKGKSSRFTASLPKAIAGQAVVVKFAAIRIDDRSYRLAFESAAHDDRDSHAAMPTKVEESEEVTLYRTPGGKYTATDIAANGNKTASEKFKGIKGEHDSKPKPGDKLCPISMTKASAKFTWIIDGKAYEFCCPPCVDEFVALAKTKSADIKPPEFYLMK